jgi:DNA (cytosine-5)-methyltransferase 1
MNYYNEFDPKAAAWLRELIAAGLIPAGIVDTRSITEIQPHELKPFTQCHFFAGIGGWSLALQLAGWPATRPVWTGSCPCQPFSTAGKQLGQADERHLWPVFFNLISECRPDVVFGEQVAAAIGKGWLDGVSSDLEGAGYACGSAVIGAHSVGSPHIRQRLYWMADAASERGGPRGTEREGQQRTPSHGGVGGGLADATGGQREQSIRPQGDVFQRPSNDRATGRMADIKGGKAHTATEGRLHAESGGSGRLVNPDCSGPLPGDAATKADRHGRPVVSDGRDGWMDHTFQSRLEGHTGNGDNGNQPGWIGADATRPVATASRDCWSRFDLIPCADGKARRIEPGLAPLVAGLPRGVVYGRDSGVPINPQATGEARVMRLRGYGNSIVPQLAAEFVSAYLDIQNWRN